MQNWMLQIPSLACELPDSWNLSGSCDRKQVKRDETAAVVRSCLLLRYPGACSPRKIAFATRIRHPPDLILSTKVLQMPKGYPLLWGEGSHLQPCAEEMPFPSEGMLQQDLFWGMPADRPVLAELAFGPSEEKLDIFLDDKILVCPGGLHTAVMPQEPLWHTELEAQARLALGSPRVSEREVLMAAFGTFYWQRGRPLSQLMMQKKWSATPGSAPVSYSGPIHCCHSGVNLERRAFARVPSRMQPAHAGQLWTMVR